MDIKNLLDNLHDQVSCSACLSTLTDPRQLPCLHSFCLNCLNELASISDFNGPFLTCPECRKRFRIPGSGNPSEFPSNFRINSLLDVLAIKEYSTARVKCGNCDKLSAQTSYCFQCGSFWCDECISAHNIIRANKEHRTLAINDFQDQDIEDLLRRPAFCQKRHHEKELLRFYCKDCKVAVCNTCVVTLHDGHNKMLLQEATDARRSQINSTIASLKQKVLEERKEVEKYNQKIIEIQMQVADVESQVEKNVDQIIGIVNAKKQKILDAVDSQARKSLEFLTLKKEKVQNKVTLVELATDQTESLMKRGSSAEILGFNETFDTILQRQSTEGSVDSECISRFKFTESKKLISLLNSEGIGSVKSVLFEVYKDQQLETNCNESSKASGGMERANVRGSPFEPVQKRTRRFKSVLSFGQPSVEILDRPWGVAVNSRDEIAVSEYGNCRISLFSSDGTYLRSFGKPGQNNGEFSFPCGIIFDKNHNILVADCHNPRVQVFDRNGNFLRKFGEQGCLDHQLNKPVCLSIDDNDDIIVTDQGYLKSAIKIFSSNGKYLRKFGEAGSLTQPYHCIQNGQYFIVSDTCSIKMFNLDGKFIYTFGKKGVNDGELNKPRYLSVSKDGLLMVCDSYNHRVQVFQLPSGKFVTKFGCKGSERGEFRNPNATANLSDGRIVLCDQLNDRIQIFDQM